MIAGCSCGVHNERYRTSSVETYQIFIVQTPLDNGLSCPPADGVMTHELHVLSHTETIHYRHINLSKILLLSKSQD